jgi:hypothetical protein
MGRAILVHANCYNPNAKGDFVFAANIARDLIQELNHQSINDIDVVLASPLQGIGRFKSLYSISYTGRLMVNGISVGLSSLEEFDSIEHSVVAFIDANRCKYSPEELIKRVVSPSSKFLFVGNANQQSYADIFSQTLYSIQIRQEQPTLYQDFDNRDMYFGSAGLGIERLGLPSIRKHKDLKNLTESEIRQLPKKEYGFMYLSDCDPYNATTF